MTLARREYFQTLCLCLLIVPFFLLFLLLLLFFFHVHAPLRVFLLRQGAEMGYLVSWCFEPRQPLVVTSGLIGGGNIAN